MPSIKTLRDDVYKLFDPKSKVVPKDEDLDTFLGNMRSKLIEKLGGEYKPSLRMSSIGQPCARKGWYELHEPDKAEAMQPWVYIKFLYGDLIEQLLMFLIKTAGHKVTHEQETLEIDGVPGHTDGMVDDVPVDIKSASSYGFKKFESGLKKEDDGFGYLNHLGLYNKALGNEGPAAFIAFEKQSGESCVDMHDNLNDVDYNELVRTRKKIMSLDVPPPRGFDDLPEGASGNRKLGLNCGYCNHRRHCWPGLRTFLYSRGPVHLTNVARLPDVTEVL